MPNTKQQPTTRQLSRRISLAALRGDSQSVALMLAALPPGQRLDVANHVIGGLAGAIRTIPEVAEATIRVFQQMPDQAPKQPSRKQRRSSRL